MGKDVLNLQYYKGSDLYCDGEIEDELLEIVNENDDYENLLQSDNRWPILYHLSKIRHNLLEWYDFDKDASLLEIGSGCGALSGLFCEKVNRVVGIELSKKRSLINAGRNKKYNNLEIYVGNFEDIDIKEKFDYVTLIGVLEYSPAYINSASPFEDMLIKAGNYLKDDGKLIIAIENKFGLKYFNGVAEDHTGNLFDGIDGYKSTDSVRTLTKNDIEKLLVRSGYNNNYFYYPLPDYKMPNVVYSEEYLPSSGDLRNMSDVYDRERYSLFDAVSVYDQLCDDNKFEYFSNSFLIFASK